MELMAPAGDFQAAYQALTHGADAVYLGLQDFSARRSAANFSIDEARRIIAFAHQQDSYVYITMNTIIRDQELRDAVRLLHSMALLRPDGIIVQDLGLARIIRKYFPSLSLHASTQLAAHTTDGVRFLQESGFSRVVLARELSLQEIRQIRTACPEVELEVFIHGAMCYSISGACLASGRMLGRSGNRGECAQICRTYSRLDEQEGYFFSMKDLFAGEQVRTLSDIGVHTLKIEGRMKSPAYAAEISAYYRALLDGREPSPAPGQILFSRSQSSGYLHRDRDTALIDASYPSHTGVSAGRILKCTGNRVNLILEEDISLRDGILILSAEKGSRSDGVPFSLSDITDRSGRRMTSARAGEQVWIGTPKSCRRSDEIRIISRHDQELPKVHPNSIKPQRYQAAASVVIDDREMHISCTIPEIGFQSAAHYPVALQEALKPSDITEVIRRQFSTSDPAYVLQIADISLENRSRYAEDRIFLQQKLLKQIKREWYGQLHTSLERHIEQRSRSISEKTCPEAEQEQLQLPRRSLIAEAGVRLGDIHYLPLNPAVFSPERYFAGIEQQIRTIRNEDPEVSIAVGLNNIGHIHWFLEQKGLLCFIDVYLYTANRHTAGFFAESIPGCIGAYHWIEEPFDPPYSWALRISDAQDVSNIPIFISRSCFRKDALQKSCESCSTKDHSYRLQQNGKQFTVRVKDCMTYVYRP